SVSTAELDEVWDQRHAAIFVHDLADNSRRNQSCHPCQVHRGLGLSGAHQHAALTSAQRKSMSWTHQIAWPRLGIDSNLNGACAVIGGDARRHSGTRFN